MRRFPVRVLSVALLAFALSVLPAVAAQASPWAVSPLQGGWFAKAELLLTRAWVRWSAGERDASRAVQRNHGDHQKDSAVIDPDG